MTPGPVLSFRKLIGEVAKQLQTAAVPESNVDARLLVRHAAGLSAEKLLSSLADPVPEAVHEQVGQLAERRANREPLQYITGRAEFFGRGFQVDHRALIPRPETEQLVEQAIGFVQRHKLAAPRFADIGTGSGALAVTLALELPGADVWATDISKDGLEVARINAAALGANVQFAPGSLLEPLEGQFDVIVSNPPYIQTSALAKLEPELAWEPQKALDGGEDGLDVIQPLLASLPRFLRQNAACVLVEIDPPVASESAKLARGSVPGARVDVLTDLAGLERVLVIERE